MSKHLLLEYGAQLDILQNGMDVEFEFTTRGEIDYTGDISGTCGYDLTLGGAGELDEEGKVPTSLEALEFNKIGGTVCGYDESQLFRMLSER